MFNSEHFFTKLVKAIFIYLLFLTNLSFASDYQIGVYYYPGWSPSAKGSELPTEPWAPIKKFPERKPTLGWYEDNKVGVLNQQLEWIHDNGIRFISFDWYWSGDKPFLEQALNAYLQAPNRKLVSYSLLWANHFPMPKNQIQFNSMVQYWIDHHFKNPEYLRINNKPVVFIFSPDQLSDNSAKFGSTSKNLLNEAQKMAQASGMPGIYFIMGSPALEHWIKGHAPQVGFDATSAYNYHNGFNGSAESKTPPSHSFTELDAYYQMNWDWILKNSNLPYIIPMTSGWDKRPWGGSSDSEHDNSMGTADQFEQHLIAAKKRMDLFPAQTLKTGIICCWNEFGEGSFIEPTQKNGFDFLSRVKKVFNSHP